MTLNGTLIAQAINFFIAYWLLRLLYFKPAIAQIQQEEAAHARVENAILERTLAIEQKERQHKEYWAECQRYCQEQMPAVPESEIVMHTHAPHIEPAVYDERALAKMSNLVADELVQRIDHVS